MRNLQEIIAKSMRLGAASFAALQPEIERCIRTARAEMVRAGVPEETASSGNVLVADAIVTYAAMKLGDAGRYEQYREAWEYQVDCIRKSKLEAGEGTGIV